MLPSHWGSPGRWSRAMCLSPSAAAGLGLTLTVCSGFGVAVPSADLGCDDLTTTCHLPPKICCCFLGCFFFKGMFLSVFLETTSLISLI